MGEGILFTVEGISPQGVIQMAFFEEGVQKIERSIQNSGMETVQSYFPWMPSEVGVYQLSFTSTDRNGLVSDPASITIGVISDGLSQASVDKTEAAVSNSEPINTALVFEAEVSGDANLQSNEEGQQENIGAEQDQIPDVGFEGGEDGAPLDRPLEDDHPPEIIAFEMEREPVGNNARISLTITGQDDVGVEAIFLGIASSIEGEEPLKFITPCHANTPCNSAESVLLKGGASYDLYAIAVDTIGQISAAATREIEIGAPAGEGEGPAIADEGLGQVLPIDLIPNLDLINNGIFHMQPFVFSGLLDVEQGERADTLDDCNPSTLSEVRLSFDQSWMNNHDPILKLNYAYPCNLHPEIEDGFACITINEINLDCQPDDFYRFGWAHTSWMREQKYENYDLTSMYSSQRGRNTWLCGKESATFRPVMVSQAGEILERGNPVQIEPLPCPPPEIDLYMEGSGNCPDSDRGDDYCLFISFLPKQDIGTNARIPVNQYEVHVSYLDVGARMKTDTYLPDGDEWLLTIHEPLRNRVFDVQVTAVSAEGILSNTARANIRIPPPGDFSFIQSNDWQEVR